MGAGVFRLRIQGSRGNYRVLADFAGDDAEDDLGALPKDLDRQIEVLQDEIIRKTQSLLQRAPAAEQASSGISLRNFAYLGKDADIKAVQEIGGQLFDCVFQRDVFGLYKKTLQSVQNTKTKMPVKLCIEAPELSDIPWETMFDRRGLFHLCCYDYTPFSRATENDELERFIFNSTPLRILGMISRPKSLRGTPLDLDTDREQAALDKALKPLKKDNKVRLCWTSVGTAQQLSDRIYEGDEGKSWDIFLFIGHGENGRLVLEHENGEDIEVVTADVLKGYLATPNGPQLVILNSCKGAQIGRGNRFASTAETLVRGGGIAAAVAMQFDISNEMATAFSPIFISHLLRKIPMQAAMMFTRLDLQRRGFAEWISPVLYLNTKDGQISPAESAPTPLQS
jgi:hypothetical protein